MTQSRITQITVCPPNEPIFSEMATTIQISDEAAGEFVELMQTDFRPGKIRINPEEWPAIRMAINRLIRQCRDES